MGEKWVSLGCKGLIRVRMGFTVLAWVNMGFNGLEMCSTGLKG